jgi:hypothetical protein
MTDSELFETWLCGLTDREYWNYRDQTETPDAIAERVRFLHRVFSVPR